MQKSLPVAAAVLLLTAVGYFEFPGHTYLLSDAQIYIPILEHYRDPSLFTREMVAVRPHVAFTIYDEMALGLRHFTGLGFEQVLTIQQLLFRALGILGVFLIATSMGLSRQMAFLVSSIFALGAMIGGPTVLTFEYEPIPRGFAVPLLLLASGMVAHGRDFVAGIAAALAFLYHPPTVYTFWGVYFLLTLWPNKPAVMSRRILGLLPMLCAVVVLLFLSRLQAGVTEAQPFFSRISPELEKLQRMRAPYNWVSLWFPYWHWLSAFLWAVSLAAYWRVRKWAPEDLRFFLVGLPLLGILSLPLSYVLLEKLAWILIPQAQPARAVLFVTVFAGILASVAGVKAVEAGRRIEGVVWFVLAFAIPIHTRLTELLLPDLSEPLIRRRLLLAVAFSGGAVVAAWAASVGRKWAPAGVVLVALAPFWLIPSYGNVVTYREVRTPELLELCDWARQETAKDAMFLFPNAGRSLEPGIFRATALRAVYVDWKAGGQVNFFPKLGFEWWERWQQTMARPFRSEKLPLFASLGIDFIVLPAKNRLKEGAPVYSNAGFVVYALRK